MDFLTDHKYLGGDEALPAIDERTGMHVCPANIARMNCLSKGEVAESEIYLWRRKDAWASMVAWRRCGGLFANKDAEAQEMPTNMPTETTKSGMRRVPILVILSPTHSKGARREARGARADKPGQRRSAGRWFVPLDPHCPALSRIRFFLGQACRAKTRRRRGQAERKSERRDSHKAAR